MAISWTGAPNGLHIHGLSTNGNQTLQAGFLAIRMQFRNQSQALLQGIQYIHRSTVIPI